MKSIQFRVLLLFNFLLISFFTIRGETAFPNLRFKHYTVEDGLSINTISCITQDSKGFIWIGTSNGLNRYDGRKFKLFIPESNGESISSGNNVGCIQEGSDGGLWIGTDFGLYQFNPKTESFALFRTPANDGVIINSRVSTIIKDQNDNLWISSFSQGVFHYDIKKNELIHFSHNPRNSNSICSNRIRRVFEDSRGNIWFLSFDNGFTIYNKANNSYKHYIAYSKADKDRYDVVYEDTRGDIWLGSFSNGLSKFDYRTGKFTHYLAPGSESHVLHIRSIIEYSPALLLLASDDGMTYFNTETGKSKTIKSSRFNRSGINDDYLHALFKDKEGGLWIGSYFGGINYTSSGYSNFNHYSNSTGDTPFLGRIVSVICEDPKGNVWIGTDDAGLFYFDVKNHSFKQYLPQKGKNSLSYHNIHALLYDDEKLWIGTYSGGLDCLDLRTGIFKNYKAGDSKNSLYLSSVYALYKDKKGVIWVGTPYGLCKYNQQADDFERIEITFMSDISSILEDKKGNLWASTLNDGVYRLDEATGKWKRYHNDEKNKESLKTNVITSLCLDDQSRLWIGTYGSEICYFDYKRDRFVPVESNKFPSKMVDMIIADDGYLWVTSNIGLIRYQPDKHTFKIYNKSDGLQSTQFNRNSGLISSDGTIYLGGINGFNTFNPSYLNENSVIPNVVISNFQLFNKDVIYNDQSGDFKTAITYADEIQLSYDQSFVAFDFVSLSYMAPEKNQYSYILEGFDKEWTKVKGEPRVSYTNLPPGEYTFRVKASNNDELWNDNGVSLKVKIIPPFWKTKLAYFIYFLLLIGILVFLFRFMKKRELNKHQMEIDRINVEKDKEVYDAKINFFTQIIHEIRTPLTLIIGPLEHVLKSTKRVSEVKEDLLVVQRNSNRLLTLVNQLLDFRKMESGNVVLKITGTEINSLVTQVYENFRIQAEQKGIELTLKLSEKDCFIQTNPEAITKILSNLLSNAFKFTKDIVKVEVINKEQNRQIILKVTDNGHGVSMSERENIFKPFYQISENQPSDGLGTGIGLALTKSLISLLSGDILIEDSPTGGLIFTVIIPIIEAGKIDVADVQPIAENKKELQDEDFNSEEFTDDDLILNLPSILVVDDNEEIRKYLLQQLNPYYRVICAADAEEASVVLEDKPADLIVSDIMMPGIDGFQFCNQVKTNITTSHIPVILLTAKANIEAKIEGLENGADAYIEKPFMIEHLRAQIKSLLLNREMIKQRFANSPTMPALSVANSKADMLFLQKVEEFIAKNITRTEFSIGAMAQDLGMGRSSFFAKLRAVSGLTPSDYIRVARLKKAVELFKGGETRVNEVCFMVGFNSPSYFSKCFQQQFGDLPSNYIKKMEEKAPAT